MAWHGTVAKHGPAWHSTAQRASILEVQLYMHMSASLAVWQLQRARAFKLKFVPLRSFFAGQHDHLCHVLLTHVPGSGTKCTEMLSGCTVTYLLRSCS